MEYGYEGTDEETAPEALTRTINPAAESRKDPGIDRRNRSFLSRRNVHRLNRLLGNEIRDHSCSEKASKILEQLNGSQTL